MKGIVFVKLNEFIEELWGDEFWDELLEEAELPSGGVYTTVGTYDDQEFFTLIGLVEKNKTFQQKMLSLPLVNGYLKTFIIWHLPAPTI